MAANLPTPNPTVTEAPDEGVDKDEIVSTLEGYRQEAEEARKSGPNPRDDKWEKNLNLYWNRFDFSKKADWQSQEVMPEVPAFVDRFASALKEAMGSGPTAFYTVQDDADPEGDLAPAIKRMTDVWLRRIGRNQVGQLVGFSAVFEEQMKLGALMSTSAMVTWKDDVPGGRVDMAAVDPRYVWLDPTGRNLYRLRKIELDLHDLKRLAGEKDGDGKSIYDEEVVASLTSQVLDDMKQEREQLVGHGSEIRSVRKPVVLHEYLATVLDSAGEIVSDRGLHIVANNKFLIRGPEKNPFWHGQDWLLFSPLIPVPLSPYGRSYMEDFTALAETFNKLTNLILDATASSALKAFAANPAMLIDPNQLNEGLSPNKIFLLEDGARAEDFIAEIKLGSLDPGAIQIWQAIKNELTEAAIQNEVGLGQFAPKGRTSATEIAATQQNSNAMVRAIAANVEELHLQPALDLIWKTGLQHISKDDEQMQKAVGKELFDVLVNDRRKMVERPITFSARGISTMIQKQQKLQKVLFALQTMASNELLLTEFLNRVDPGKLAELILDLLDLDLSRLSLTDRERQIKQMTEQVGQAKEQAAAQAQGKPASEGAGRNAQATAQLLGVS